MTGESTAPRALVVLLVLDAFPPGAVTPDLAPVLHGLAREGGWRPDGGQGVLTAATYPNHATFVTGATPATHGIVANVLWQDGEPVPAPVAGPALPTLLDACRAAGGATVAAVGDQYLVGVMGLAAAGTHWPPGGELPAGTATDAFGYAADRAVLDHALPLLEEGHGLAVVHLNAPDTAAHLHGPVSPEAHAAYRATDAAVGELVEALRPRWDSTVLLVCSDHSQEPVTAPEPLDLWPAVTGLGPGWAVVPEGSAAVVITPDGVADPPRLPGVTGAVPLAPGRWAVWGAPGTWFAPAGSSPRGGVHGSPRTVRQLAVVTGGAPQVPVLARTLAHHGVNAQDYAPTIADLLGVPLPTATGRSLLTQPGRP